MKTVVVAMSGGVDSSVSALLLKEQGHEVIGITLQLWDHTGGRPGPGQCCSLEDIADARRVASVIGIPFYVANYEEDFARNVVRTFSEEYTHGKTPNPCILCNEKIKFTSLLTRAQELGADFLATGHYVRKTYSSEDRLWHLFKARDDHKDQSYFLFPTSQEKLGKILFPVGEMTKGEVRNRARTAMLPVSEKKDSQEICFIPGGDLHSFFLSLHNGNTSQGEIVAQDGRILGTHRGCHLFTVGQRHGLGVSSPVPLYILHIDPETRRIIVGEEKDLYRQELLAMNPRWISGTTPALPLKAVARIRSRHEGAPCEVDYAKKGGDQGKITVRFDAPQRAITPGQAVVLYTGDEVIGGAWIERSL